MRINKNFSVGEFVHPRHIQIYGRNAKWFVSDWQIKTAVFVREFFDNRRMTLNDHLWGGGLKNRGTRLPDSSVGSFLSMHKHMMAEDFNIEGLTAEECYDAIIDNQHEFVKRGITTIESLDFTPTWIHLDGRNTGRDKMLIVAPRVNTLGNHFGFLDENWDV